MSKSMYYLRVSGDFSDVQDVTAPLYHPLQARITQKPTAHKGQPPYGCDMFYKLKLILILGPCGVI